MTKENKPNKLENIAKIHSHCIIDKKLTKWTYIGDQPTTKEGQYLHLFNCDECGTTRTMGALMSYNLDVQWSKRVESW